MVCCFRIWVSFNSTPSFPPPFVRRWFHRQWEPFWNLSSWREFLGGSKHRSTSAHSRPSGPIWPEWFSCGSQWGLEESAVHLQWDWDGHGPHTFPFLPLSLPGRDCEPLMRGSTFQITSTVCSSLRELTRGALVKPVNSSSREAPTSSQDTFGLFALAPHPASVSPAESNALIPKVLDFGCWKHTYFSTKSSSFFILLIFSGNVGLLIRTQI